MTRMGSSIFFRKIACYSILASLGVLLSCASSGAHGVEAWVNGFHQTAPTINFSYSDGSPVSYASVKIWSPGNNSIEYQNGRTDKNGRFSFLPDSAGEWRITLNDGQGHAATLHHQVEERGEATTTEMPAGPAGTVERSLFALLGSSLIVNLGFAVHFFRKKAFKKLGGPEAVQ